MFHNMLTIDTNYFPEQPVLVHLKHAGDELFSFIGSCTVICNLPKHQLSNGHAMAQMAGHQPQTLEAQLQSQVSPCDTCRQSENGTGFLRVLQFLPCQRHTTNTPHSSPSTCCCYQKDKWVKPGELSKRHVVLETREHCTEKYSHIFKSVYKGFKLSDPGLWDGQGTMHA